MGRECATGRVIVPAATALDHFVISVSSIIAIIAPRTVLFDDVDKRTP
jgi:hypothetical protein